MSSTRLAFSGLLPLENIPDYEEQIRALLNRSVPHGDGDMTIEQIMAYLEDGEMILVCAIQDDGKMLNALALQVIDYPNQRVLLVAYGAGSDMKQHMETVIAIAKAAGCDVIEARCRPDVARLFLQEGFYPACIVLRLRDFK